MIRSVIRWMRQVLPADWMVGSFFAMYVATVAPYVISLWWGGPNVASGDLLHIRDGLLMIAAMFYGTFRVSGLHPMFRPDYHAWLAATPWTRDKPLPLGPVHLVLQDAIVVGVLMALMHLPQTSRLVLPFLFLFAYLATLALGLALADRFGHAYVMAFGLGVAVLTRGAPLQSALALAAIYMVGYAGLRQSLADFPWPRAEKMGETMERVNRGVGGQDLLGWPHDQLSPKPTEVGISYGHGVGISLLAGWWAYVATALFPAPLPGELLTLVIIPTLFGCMFGRLATYCRHRGSPLSLWGRLWTLRWIIPSYDKVFIAPLCVPISLAFISWLSQFFSIPLPISFALSEAAMLLIALTVGPRLRVWQLTGGHRIKPSMNTAASKELMKI